MDNKFSLQDETYSFPYHFLAGIMSDGSIRLHRELDWGLEYLTYLYFIKLKVIKISPDSLLDVGCGDGRFLSMLKDIKCLKTGIDLSSRAISLARILVPEATFAEGNLSDLKGRFSLITCIETLEHIPNDKIESFIKNLSDKIAKMGSLIVSVPSVIRPLNKKHYRHYTIKLLEQQLSPYFCLTEYRYLYRRSWLSYVLKRLLVNRLYILNYLPARRWIWKLHLSFTFYGNATNGEHIVAVFKPTYYT